MRTFLSTKIKKGFTLVETLVSTGIISLVILGPLTVAMNASSYAKQTKDTMIAGYLAQEGAELLRHVQDSLYLKCIADTGSFLAVCQPQLGSGGEYESPEQTAWRVFKSYLGGTDSCFSSSKCAYDFIDMTTDEISPPTKYIATSGQCDTLSITDTNTYVCTGAHGSAGTPTTFSRSVYVESIPTFAGADATYNDDLRVTVYVTFTRSTGYTRTVKLVDFLHAHP